jgi:hypothetical protein
MSLTFTKFYRKFTEMREQRFVWIVLKVQGRMLHMIKDSAAKQLQGNPNVREIKKLIEMAKKLFSIICLRNSR